MKVLIVDGTSEGKLACAKLIEQFPSGAAEHLDLHVKLSAGKDPLEKVAESDVLVLGADMGDQALTLTRKAVGLARHLQVIIFTRDAHYSEEFLRAAYAAGARKILSERSPALDLYQELLAINAGFRREGKTKEGKLVVVTSAKGGSGATTVAAALGEVTSEAGVSVLLWDLDVDTRDLSRALLAFGSEGELVSRWVRDLESLTKESFRKGIVPVGGQAGLLVAPDSLAEGMDLLCHVDGVTIAQRILELARLAYDVIIVDAGGVTGPAKGALMRAADRVVMVVGDSPLAYTAAEHSLKHLKKIVGDTTRVSFLCSGGKLTGPEIRATIDPQQETTGSSWSLPILEFDSRGQHWPGTNETLYSKGSGATKARLIEIALKLGLVKREQLPASSFTGGNSRGGIVDKLRGGAEHAVGGRLAGIFNQLNRASLKRA